LNKSNANPKTLDVRSSFDQVNMQSFRNNYINPKTRLGDHPVSPSALEHSQEKTNSELHIIKSKNRSVHKSIHKMRLKKNADNHNSLSIETNNNIDKAENPNYVGKRLSPKIIIKNKYRAPKISAQSNYQPNQGLGGITDHQELKNKLYRKGTDKYIL
jgi:hypothetical protein